MSKKVKKMAFGGLNSAPIKTALTLGGPAPVTPTAPLRQAPAPVVPTKTSLGGGKPAPVANQPVRGPVVDPVRPQGPVNQPVRGPLPQATNPVRPIGGQARPPATGGLPAPGIGGRPPIGGQARPPAGNPAMMKKGGSVKSSASKRADGIATKGKTKGRIV